MKTEHILIIRFGAMGDVAMAVPVVYSLARQYPDLRITVLSRPFARTLFEQLAPNVNFMAADLKNEYKGVKGLNALYRRLIAKNFTLIADFHDILRSQYLRMRFNLSRHKVAHINKHRSAKRRLTRQNSKVMEQLPTSFENYAQVLDELGYPVKLQFTSIYGDHNAALPPLPPTLEEKNSTEEWLGIAPFAAHKGKIYPIEKMEEAVRLIAQRHPSCRIFLFGGGDREMEVLNQWAASIPQCTTAASLVHGLGEELRLMATLKLMVSMDSANMHLASLVATPVLSIWGATHPMAGFMGWNQSLENALQASLDCRPCSIYGKKPCLRGDYACLAAITPTMIADKVDNILNKNT